jgi:hypothetical protein
MKRTELLVVVALVGIAATVVVAVLLFSRNVALVDSNWMSSYQTTGLPKEMIDPSPAPDAYPTDRARPEGTPETRSYSFRPSDDTGSDTFVRMGPDLNEKIDVLR